MSFTKTPERTIRLNRSQLAVPASQPRMIEKAAACEADIVFLDLEDAVAPADKASARQNVVNAIKQKEWGRKSVSFRVNGLDTHYMYRDLIDVQAGRGASEAPEVRLRNPEFDISRAIRDTQRAYRSGGQLFDSIELDR